MSMEGLIDWGLSGRSHQTRAARLTSTFIHGFTQHVFGTFCAFTALGGHAKVLAQFAQGSHTLRPHQMANVGIGHILAKTNVHDEPS